MAGRRVGVLWCALALGFAACGQASLQQVAEDVQSDGRPGGVLVVATEDDGTASIGVAGVDATGTPMTADATWRIGSITKTFTAVVVMQMVEEGAFGLDDDVGRYLDNPQVPPGVTVRQLLQHTSGIPDYIPHANVVLRSCPESAIDPFALIVNDVPAFAPGEGWEYSNTNYLVLGQLIRALTGQPPADAIRGRIIDPLGLNDTYLEGSEPGPPPVPAFADFYDTGPGPITCHTPIWADATDAGMISSAHDLDRFLRAIFDGTLVSAGSLTEMLDTNEFGYGLGISKLLQPPVEDVEIYGNGGGLVGYKSVALYETKRRTTIIAMSPTGFSIGGLQDRAIEWAFSR